MLCNYLPCEVKIEVFQTHFSGNIYENVASILEKYHQSTADVCIFPELSIIGYLLEDLLYNQTFIDEISKINQQIISQTNNKAIVFGSIIQKDGRLFNTGIVAQHGKVIEVSTKKNLPNSGVFCESRYFTSGEPSIVNISGIKFGILICEDTWHESSYSSIASADIILSLNASPFEISPDRKTKLQKRIEVFEKYASSFKKPFVYCNCVGFYNGILFDGNSFIKAGNLKIMKSFQEDSYIFSTDKKITNGKYEYENTIQLKKEAIIFGIHDFFKKTGQKKAIIGLSGGADSAIVAALAIEALGRGNVLCVMMPSRHTSQESITDATLLAKNIGATLLTIPIQKTVDEYQDALKLSGTALENIQARVRGNILMAISNQENGLVLTTGNKSEVAVGYCTLYGDMCGALNPIKDLYKTEVFEMMRFINQSKEIIPRNIITKEPTAELRENQKDSDYLPKYEILDPILMELIEEGRLPNEITCFEKTLVEKVYKMLRQSEFKRWQACVGIKLSSKSFEKSDWKFNL